jgi:Alpha-L-arabinofuranosidase B (ABFB) domain
MSLCSIRSEAHRGLYIRHQCYRCKLGDRADEQSRKDASFWQRPGVAGGPGFVSFEAEHFPGHYLRVRGGNELWLDRHDGSEQCARESTFRLCPGPAGLFIESLAFPAHFLLERGHMVDLAGYSEHHR